MMQFDYIGVVPVMPARIVADIIGIPVSELIDDYRAHTDCGVWMDSGYPSLEFDELWDYLEPRYPAAYHAIFG